MQVAAVFIVRYLYRLSLVLVTGFPAAIQRPAWGKLAGDRVRLTLADSNRIQGIFVARQDSVLASKDTTVMERDPRHLEVGIPRSWDALAAGIVVGGLTAGALDQPASRDSRRWIESPSRSPTPLPNPAAHRSTALPPSYRECSSPSTGG